MRWTSEGRKTPLFLVGDNSDSSKKIWRESFRLDRAFPTRGLHPGATVHARFNNPDVPGRSGRATLIASRDAGKGRVLYIGTSELWRLRQVGKAPLRKFWVHAVQFVKRNA